MALKLKQYTPEYKGLDAEYYLSRKAPIIIIITNRNTGKTTNILGKISEIGKGFMPLTRYKSEIPFAQSKLIDACKCYNTNLTFNKKTDSFQNEQGKDIGFIRALSGAQDVKNSAEKYHGVDYLVFDEFLPVDRRYLKETTSPGYELEALRWIIGSVRKGGDGQIHRDLKVILMANLVDAINPYFKGIYDSKGVSLLTHLAGAVHSGQTNFTLDDEAVFLTVHIDKRYEATDNLGAFVSGYNSDGLAEGFLKDFSYRVLSKRPEIIKQLKTPVLSIGIADMYVIRVKTKLDFGNTMLNSDMPIFYWVSNKNSKSTPLQELLQFDFTERFSYYENIVVKAQVQDFMTKYRIQTRYDF